MREIYIHALNTDDAGLEEPAATRERLRGLFPAGAARRMTQLGMLVGSVLGPLAPEEEDALVYASQFGESRSLEAYLDSFPSASPTLFQTSIHPSGVQQLMIGRQMPASQLFPLSGDTQLVVQALLTASLTRSPRTLFCGGDERGSWLFEKGQASPTSFAFALALGPGRTAQSLGRVILEPCREEGALSLPAWFRLLHERTAASVVAGGGWHLRLEWF